MRFRVKQICFLILGQTLCVAIGLWMQHRYAVSSIHTTVEQQAWLRLERWAEGLSKQLGTPAAGETPTPPTKLARALRFGWPRFPQQAGVILVDAGWNVLTAARDRDSRSGAAARPALSWKPVPGPPGKTDRSARGTLILPDGAHIAVRRALPAGAGYLVIHQPVAAIEAEAAAVGRPLGPINAVMAFWTVALLTIAALVVLGWHHERDSAQRGRSIADLLRPARSLVRTRDAVIFGLAKLADSRDADTGEHLERISAYSTILATELRRRPKYASEVTLAFVRLIRISAALHDIGKVGIEDRILLKRGPLSRAERARIQRHTVIGGECLREIEQRLGTSNFLQMAREITFSHHERWNGEGYPHGLAGEAIPLAARIVAIADVYDALSSKRVYKPAFPHEKCVAIIRSEAGTHFDPDLVEAWLNVEPQFRAVAERCATRMPPSLQADGRGATPVVRAGHDEPSVAPAAQEADGDAEALPELSMLDR